MKDHDAREQDDVGVPRFKSLKRALIPMVVKKYIYVARLELEVPR
jgi:hypothetical protein